MPTSLSCAHCHSADVRYEAFAPHAVCAVLVCDDERCARAVHGLGSDTPVLVASSVVDTLDAHVRAHPDGDKREQWCCVHRDASVLQAFRRHSELLLERPLDEYYEPAHQAYVLPRATVEPLQAHLRSHLALIGMPRKRAVGDGDDSAAVGGDDKRQATDGDSAAASSSDDNDPTATAARTRTVVSRWARTPHADRRSGDSASPFEQLPADVLVQILMRTSATDVYTMRAVSRRLARLIGTSNVVRKTYARDDSLREISAHLTRLEDNMGEGDYLDVASIDDEVVLTAAELEVAELECRLYVEIVRALVDMTLARDWHIATPVHSEHYRNSWMRLNDIAVAVKRVVSSCTPHSSNPARLKLQLIVAQIEPHSAFLSFITSMWTKRLAPAHTAGELASELTRTTQLVAQHIYVLEVTAPQRPDTLLPAERQDDTHVTDSTLERARTLIERCILAVAFYTDDAAVPLFARQDSPVRRDTSLYALVNSRWVAQSNPMRVDTATVGGDSTWVAFLLRFLPATNAHVLRELVRHVLASNARKIMKNIWQLCDDQVEWMVVTVKPAIEHMLTTLVTAAGDSMRNSTPTLRYVAQAFADFDFAGPLFVRLVLHPALVAPVDVLRAWPVVIPRAESVGHLAERLLAATGSNNKNNNSNIGTFVLRRWSRAFTRSVLIDSALFDPRAALEHYLLTAESAMVERQHHLSDFNDARTHIEYLDEVFGAQSELGRARIICVAIDLLCVAMIAGSHGIRPSFSIVENHMIVMHMLNTIAQPIEQFTVVRAVLQSYVAVPHFEELVHAAMNPQQRQRLDIAQNYTLVYALMTELYIRMNPRDVLKTLAPLGVAFWRWCVFERAKMPRTNHGHGVNYDNDLYTQQVIAALVASNDINEMVIVPVEWQQHMLDTAVRLHNTSFAALLLFTQGFTLSPALALERLLDDTTTDTDPRMVNLLALDMRMGAPERATLRRRYHDSSASMPQQAAAIFAQLARLYGW